MHPLHPTGWSRSLSGWSNLFRDNCKLHGYARKTWNRSRKQPFGQLTQNIRIIQTAKTTSEKKSAASGKLASSHNPFDLFLRYSRKYCDCSRVMAGLSRDITCPRFSSSTKTTISSCLVIGQNFIGKWFNQLGPISAHRFDKFSKFQKVEIWKNNIC